MGVALFNQGDYFAAHEALEDAWRAEREPIRDLYRGILQVGVAYYHLLNGNYIGARKMLLRCRQWLDPFPALCRGCDVEKLRQDAYRVEAELIRLGAGGLASFDRRQLKPVHLQPD